MAWRSQLCFIALFFLASIFHHLCRHLFILDDVFLEDVGIRLPLPRLTTFKTQSSNLAIQEPAGDQVSGNLTTQSILFHDWEVFLVLPAAPQTTAATPYSCIFHGGATSPATPVGVLASGGRPTFKCIMPNSVRRHRPFLTPTLAGSPENDTSLATMLRWNFYVYESFSTETDVVVFAKGINKHHGVNLPAASLRCVFENGVKTDVTSSSQEVFRCPHPARRIPSMTRVSLEIGYGSDKTRAVPSLAIYDPKPRTLAPRQGKAQLCACTVVYDVAKFVREWVIYHASIGVEKFVFYDNGSDDDFYKVVGQLVELGHDVATFYWPWPKTQEAGFSHCAMAFRDSCTWMLFTDVDEFVFSPRWQNSSRPSKHMLQSLLPESRAMIGQMTMKCYDFGPSNRRSHPIEGVTQGYTCRLHDHQRHKSIVLLDGVDQSLENAVHHFKMKGGYTVRKLTLHEGVVNHYKYQVWAEFKNKFKRRVSAYVYDWRNPLNPASKDRTPGLGNEPIEPQGWASRFCEVNDTGLRDLGRSWFTLEGSTQDGGRFAWQDE